jgi:GNAT superfamily N-acetyltransferase
VSFTLRRARDDDVPALEVLIALSVRALQAAHYSPEQMNAALGPVFGVDRELIGDGTFFVAASAATIVGCGGWSRRQSLFGGKEAHSAAASPLLDPAIDPARIRAFFVHPQWVRRGIGRSILRACEEAAHAAGFRSATLVATLAGEPLYASFAYVATRRYEIPLAGGLQLPAVQMDKSLALPQSEPAAS